MTDIKRGFIAEETLVQHYTFGSGRLTERFGAVALNPKRDWEKYLPDGERQSNDQLETFACTVAGSLNAWETVANLLKKKGIIHNSHFPKNCSERFNAILAGITPRGGSPFKSSESISKRGVILDEVLPFAENIWSWDLYYHPKPMTEALLKLGKETTKYVHLQYEWLFNDESEKIPLAEKRNRIAYALERGTVCVSMYAWKEKNGVYYKDPRDTDTHWTMLYTLDDYDRCFDTYVPFKKKIAPDTDYYCAMMYTMSPKTQSEIDAEERQINGLLSQVLGLLQRLYAMLKAPAVVPVEPPKLPQEAPLPPKPAPMPKKPLGVDYGRWPTLVKALIQVESGGLDTAVGDKHLTDKAYGCLQIRKPYITDVNRVYKTNLKAQDMLGNRQLSIDTFYKYMDIYATKRQIGREPTDQDRARIHNAGPSGWKNPHPNPNVQKMLAVYWAKVNKFIP